jgi:hypothetical protein
MSVNARKLWALAAVVGVAACSDSQEGSLAPAGPELAEGHASVQVTNSNDDGPGSFRAAVAAANARTSVREITFQRLSDPIALLQPVVYTGGQALAIRGNDAVVDGAGLAADVAGALVATGGSDLTLASLTVRNSPQQGVAVQVPADATGTLRYELSDLTITGNQGHGVLINDQVNPEDVADPTGSDASIDVTVTRTRFEGNGFGALDRDGLRVNEGGLGELRALITLTQVEANGGDGIELDERAVGDVRFTVSQTRFTRNGNFDQTLADLDDGFDVDESNAGDLIGTVVQSLANDNFEEGFDLNENHEGDFRVDMNGVEASRNLEEGFDFEEDDDFQGGGDLIAAMQNVTADGNGPGGDGGIKIRERGDGNLDAGIRGARTAGNGIDGINIREQATGSLVASIEQAVSTGNLSGIAVREDDDGSLAATVDRSTVDGNSAQGVDFDENSTGDLAATVRRTSSTDNGGAGVRADQAATGLGTLDLIAATLAGNGTGSVVANAGVTVTQR